MVRFRRQQAVILAASSLILLFVISTISNLLNNRRIEGYLVARAQILEEWRQGLYPFDSKDEFSKKISKLNSSSGLCENLVANWSHFNMSTEYYRLLPQLSIRLKEGIVDERHIPRAELTHILHYLTSVKSIKTVCEVGFGYGFTSFNLITSNINVRVFSFDYAVTSDEENVASRMSSFYSDQFGEVKLTVKFGNPTSDIQSSISSGQLPLCDMILINRANLGYKIANDVIKQLSFHSSSSSSSSSGSNTVASSSKSSSSGSSSGNGVIVLVGYPTLAGYQDGRAWEEKLVDAEVAAQLLKKKQRGTTKEDSLIHVYEELRCASRDKKYGFVIGRIKKSLSAIYKSKFLLKLETVSDSTTQRSSVNVQTKPPNRLLHHKNPNGGYDVCLDGGLKPNSSSCKVMSFGINNEWSFDESIAGYGCFVHSYDPSMGLKDHMHSANVQFHNMGLGKEVIDVIKCDAEGAEWAFLEDTIENLFEVKQIILEVHSPKINPQTVSKKDLMYMIRLFMKLQESGFVVDHSYHETWCCEIFAPMFPQEISEKCCHEVYLYNTKYSS
ncbi:hypothetical protein HELRODRAFT_191922 [Helobdella robusta]|uniref:Methyltransferase domain-containing protein n=1 Tax=Helobdella robusta TaxID=6412 RepID=T1FTF1_HELRO|nr:hypothetical protein HELRODRAFT_191922 [Helobdella robusta]ESO03683.1 hypothetical protein HELRODRAFT_191922 [Helobdella robusta]